VTLQEKFAAQVSTAGLPMSGDDPTPVTEASIAHLPEPARRFLHFTGVIGKPRDWSFRAHLSGRFRRRPGRRWMPCESWQYNSGLEVARIFHMRVALAGLVPLYGRDCYLRGHGHMRDTMFGVAVANGLGFEYDVGELVTYLNDAVLLAPSFLLRLPTSWAAVDDDSFHVGLTDRGQSVTGRVVVDERGAPRDFSTDDRVADLPGGAVRARWSSSVEGWTSERGRARPIRASVVWHLPEGPFTCARFEFPPGAVEFNLPPGNTEVARNGAGR
jgi:hypothetical protein